MTKTSTFRLIGEWHCGDDYRLTEVISDNERTALRELYPTMNRRHVDAAVAHLAKPSDANGVALAGYAWAWIAMTSVDDVREARTVIHSALISRGY
ncbi:hypothetical protein [Microbacterium hatanonis]|uniref:Uncharacterized protein n=1 Tax=Microbacterium hatanonis TaxID=404366 RepID=A0A5C8I267_9MICO|nr:hypothetical protein [Microbacterium hatanonis]TXK13102.1 hypothetical protein FVP77_06665 [Microbacterium hatanonis]